MLRNLTRNTIVAEQPLLASLWWVRARGMIGREFKGFDAFILPGCNAVHTWFMTKSLDLIFLNKERRVLRIENEAKPWKMFFGPSSARTVIELPPGRLCAISVSPDDVLVWSV
jgi:uncharacterized protein